MTPDAALNDILATVGRPAADRVSITGAEPVLPSPIKLSTAGAAALAAVGTAADALWQLRGGKPQSISIDLSHAGAAVRAYELTRRNGKPVRDAFVETSTFYRCGDDRWIRTHTNFPHHLAAACETLSCAPTKDSMAAAMAGWNAIDVENAVLDAGGCAYLVRTLEEWAEHPQAMAVSTLPVLEIIKIGDAAPRPLPSGDRPLSGIRAVDLTRVIAGPMMGRTLAEHGAEVMRIASPDLPFMESLVIDTGFGKLSAYVNLETNAGTADLRRLLGQADMFVQGYRPGSIAARGFAPEDVARDFPGTVCVSLSAWGHVGPWSHRRGYDSLVQCATGWALELGSADAPKMQPAQAVDYVSGYLGAFGAMEALRRRATEGGTWLVRLSLAQTRHWINGLGRTDGADIANVQSPVADDMPHLMATTDSPFGTLVHLAHPLHLSETAPAWNRPPVPLGTHESVWPQ